MARQFVYKVRTRYIGHAPLKVEAAEVAKVTDKMVILASRTEVFGWKNHVPKSEVFWSEREAAEDALESLRTKEVVAQSQYQLMTKQRKHLERLVAELSIAATE